MKKLLLGSLFIFCVSCGIKGPPLPPIDEDVVRKQKSESVTVNSTPAPLASSSDSTKATPAKPQKKKK